jgi:hypothetical protein
MRKVTKLAIGIAATLVLLACLFTYYTHRLYERSYASEYHYAVTIETDSILHNVALYLPLPMLEGASKIGDELIAGNVSKPDDWDCNVAETEHGRMLEISAREIAPQFHPLPTPIEPGTEPQEPPDGNVSDTFPRTTVSTPEGISITVHADHGINTKKPIGNEPLLSPKYNLTRSTCELPYPEGRTPPGCYEYQSRIYTDYTAPPNAKFSIYIELEGRNSWWVYGWSGNEYRDNANVTLLGENHGWHVTSGKLIEGEGRYSWI